MKNKTLIMTVGLPRSGKSSWAKEQGIPIVNPDSVRLVVYGERWNASRENEIWPFAHKMVEALFLAGHEVVILDATNITKEFRESWKDERWTRKFKVFYTSVEECMKRAIATHHLDLIPVISKMDKRKNFYEINDNNTWKD